MLGKLAEDQSHRADFCVSEGSSAFLLSLMSEQQCPAVSGSRTPDLALTATERLNHSLSEDSRSTFLFAENQVDVISNFK